MNKHVLTELNKSGFIVSKEIPGIPAGPFKFSEFYVDDITKRFAISTGKKVSIYNYKDLLNFELDEDGNSVIKGKGLATAIGGATFGVLGAAIGAMGKRRQDNICTSLVLRIMLSDLNNPQITFTYINKDMKKSSILYKSLYESAKNLTAILTYIDNQNE